MFSVSPAQNRVFMLGVEVGGIGTTNPTIRRYAASWGGQVSGAQGQSAVTEARANQAANLTFNVILSTAKPGR